MDNSLLDNFYKCKELYKAAIKDAIEKNDFERSEILIMSYNQMLLNIEDVINDLHLKDIKTNINNHIERLKQADEDSYT